MPSEDSHIFMFLGVYIVPGISIILGWPRAQSVVFMAGGIALITVLIGLGTMGILDLFFLQLPSICEFNYSHP